MASTCHAIPWNPDVDKSYENSTDIEDHGRRNKPKTKSMYCGEIT